MDSNAIAHKFFKEFPYPDQLADMARDYLPEWLALRKVPVEQREEAIALIRSAVTEALVIARY